MASAALNTMKANPLDLPVLGSVFTFMLSISPYFEKYSLNSSETVLLQYQFVPEGKSLYTFF